MTPALRVTWSMSLTHVVQDQHFDLQQLDGFDSSNLEAGFRALAEGDATRIENRYVDSLDSADRKAYDDTTAAQSDAAGVDLSGVPDALVAYFGAPYVLGTDLVDLLEQTGGTRRSTRRSTCRPTRRPSCSTRFASSTAMRRPMSRCLRSRRVRRRWTTATWARSHSSCCSRDSSIRTTRSTPSTCGTATPTSASRATDVACVRVAIATVDAPGAGRLDQLLTEWSAAVPAADATVTRDDTTVTFESCDPGADATSVKQGLSDTAARVAGDSHRDRARRHPRRGRPRRRAMPVRPDRAGVLSRRPDRGRSGAVPDR